MRDTQDVRILVYLHQFGEYRAPDRLSEVISLLPGDVRRRLQAAGLLAPLSKEVGRLGSPTSGLRRRRGRLNHCVGYRRGRGL